MKSFSEEGAQPPPQTTPPVGRGTPPPHIPPPRRLRRLDSRVDVSGAAAPRFLRLRRSYRHLFVSKKALMAFIHVLDQILVSNMVLFSGCLVKMTAMLHEILIVVAKFIVRRG